MSDPQIPQGAAPAAPESEPDTARLVADVVSHAGTAAPGPEIAPAGAEPGLPGVHRGGFARLPTAPIGVTVESAPGEPYDPERPVEWRTPEPPARRGMAAWALVFSIGGLLVSLFVGWGFPIGIVGIVAAILALRRPTESRGAAIWALVLGILSILYSIGWLVFAAARANLFG